MNSQNLRMEKELFKKKAKTPKGWKNVKTITKENFFELFK